MPDSDTSHPVQLEVGVEGDTTVGSRDTLWQYGCIAVWQYGMDNILANMGWRISSIYRFSRQKGAQTISNGLKSAQFYKGGFNLKRM